MTRSLALATALAIIWDLRWGDPPNRFHPVAWLGRLLANVQKNAGRWGPKSELILGGAIALGIPTGVILAWHAVAISLLRVPTVGPVLVFVLMVITLKSSFAIRGLGDAAARVQRALHRNDLTLARRELGALCSRDPSALSEDEVAAAAIESVAENASDSGVAPFFFLALFGIHGIVAYRVVNTMDAMLGYRDHREYLGKASARLDDGLNWVPARLCAGLLALVGATKGLDMARGWAMLWRDGPRTPSPNAGRPMAMMAGLLGVRLTKPGVYALGDPCCTVEAADIGRAWAVARTSMVISGIACILALAGMGR